MTPGIEAAKAAGIQFELHEYEHDPRADGYGTEAAIKLNLDPASIFKTLVIQLDGTSLAVAVVPVTGQLNLKRAAKALGSKKAEMAPTKKVESTTGYVLGGVSPLGQKRQLATVIDSSAEELNTVFVSAGKRGLEIELQPADLASLTGGVFADIAA